MTLFKTGLKSNSRAYQLSTTTTVTDYVVLQATISL